MNDLSNLPLKDYQPHSELRLEDHTPQRARFPVIDAHNHLWGDQGAGDILPVMDATGVKALINLTGNAGLAMEGGGYKLQKVPFEEFKTQVMDRYPGRFFGFTLSAFAEGTETNLFKDAGFVDKAIAELEHDVSLGAIGLKLLKEFGLRFTDNSGELIAIDDARFSPVWKKCEQLGIPVLIHTSDPAAFFKPLDRHNEHLLTLLRYPDWHFANAPVSKEELLAQRDRMIEANPGTTFILPHVANWPENLAYVDQLLENHPNVVIDFSARMDELARQPYTARDFLIKHQDRVLFGTDMVGSEAIYRWYFRILETRDEYFPHPDYNGTFEARPRFYLYGLHLPDEVLEKIYWRNAVRLMPELEKVKL